MQANRRTLLKLSGATALGLIGGAARAQARPKLIVGVQTIELRESVLASKVLDGLPFDVEWAHLPGPAAQLSALYAKSIDIGLAGSTSLIFEQAKAEGWIDANPPLQIVAAWENPDQKNYPSVITAVRKESGIKTLKDLRGKRWGHNYGGYNYGQYIATLVKAGLTEKDIQASRFVDQFASGTAFNRGQLDVFSGSPTGVYESLRTGDATVLIDNRATEVPGLTIFIARQEVLRDKVKSEVLAEFLARVRRHWVWYEKNVATVEEVYLKKLQQTPERAHYTARFAASQFKPLDGELARQLQGLADLFHEFKAIGKKINVASELNPKFNVATVGTQPSASLAHGIFA
jgi:sulfonate transport system substrate-binding protein